jgi:hypothetical protein
MAFIQFLSVEEIHVSKFGFNICSLSNLYLDIYTISKKTFILKNDEQRNYIPSCDHDDGNGHYV